MSIVIIRIIIIILLSLVTRNCNRNSIGPGPLLLKTSIIRLYKSWVVYELETLKTYYRKCFDSMSYNVSVASLMINFDH